MVLNRHAWGIRTSCSSDSYGDWRERAEGFNRCRSGSDRQEANRPGAFIAYQRNAGLHRAAFWRTQGFPNLVLARAALANKVRLRRVEEWKREELKRTPFAILDEPPP
jgi:hypothetical protein